MNICMPIISSGFSGAELVVYSLAKHYSQLGHKVLLILNDEIINYYRPLEKLTNISIYKIGKIFDLSYLSKTVLHIKIPSKCIRGKLMDYSYNIIKMHLAMLYLSLISQQIANIVHGFKCQVIHVNMYLTLRLYATIYNKLNQDILRMYTFHSTIGESPLPFPWEYLLGSKNVISTFHIATAVSDDTRKFWSSIYPDMELITIPNGLDIEQIEIMNKRRRETNGFNILFPGGFKRFKGIHLIVEAFQRLASKYKDVKLIIIGNCPNDDPLYKRVRNKDLRDKIEVLGFLKHDDYLSRLASVDVVVLPSQREAFGIAVLEAMACGIPVLCTKVGGIPEFFCEGKDGWYIEPNADDLLKKLIDLYKCNAYKKLRKNSTNSMNRAKRYSWEKIAKRYVYLMESKYERLAF